MKKTCLIIGLFSIILALGACCSCEVEPIVEKNRELVVPPNFGNQPK